MILQRNIAKHSWFSMINFNDFAGKLWKDGTEPGPNPPHASCLIVSPPSVRSDVSAWYFFFRSSSALSFISALWLSCWTLAKRCCARPRDTVMQLKRRNHVISPQFLGINKIKLGAMGRHQSREVKAETATWSAWACVQMSCVNNSCFAPNCPFVLKIFWEDAGWYTVVGACTFLQHIFSPSWCSKAKCSWCLIMGFCWYLAVCKENLKVYHNEKKT